MENQSYQEEAYTDTKCNLMTTEQWDMHLGNAKPDGEIYKSTAYTYQQRTQKHISTKINAITQNSTKRDSLINAPTETIHNSFQMHCFCQLYHESDKDERTQRSPNTA